MAQDSMILKVRGLKLRGAPFRGLLFFLMQRNTPATAYFVSSSGRKKRYS